ncbi:MAG: TnsA endonuclease N-terminal domain-containing protein [Bacillota bacterium]|nr:TnsA endonuclease N-terminal domain-containing protein [Bacillota bacterium]
MELEDTLEIAEKLGIKHPVNRESKTPYVMTSDFMITINIDGKEVQRVRTIKPASDLEKKNFIEHFEIERRYWAEKGIDWGIVTDYEIPKILASNIEWAYYSYYLEPSNGLTTNELLYFAELLKDKLNKYDGKIVYITSRFDKEMNIEPGTSLDLLKHLIARKEVVMDMSSGLILSMSTDKINKIIKKEERLAAI